MVVRMPPMNKESSIINGSIKVVGTASAPTATPIEEVTMKRIIYTNPTTKLRQTNPTAFKDLISNFLH